MQYSIEEITDGNIHNYEEVFDSKESARIKFKEILRSYRSIIPDTEDIVWISSAERNEEILGLMKISREVYNQIKKERHPYSLIKSTHNYIYMLEIQIYYKPLFDKVEIG